MHSSWAFTHVPSQLCTKQFEIIVGGGTVGQKSFNYKSTAALSGEEFLIIITSLVLVHHSANQTHVGDLLLSKDPPPHPPGDHRNIVEVSELFFKSLIPCHICHCLFYIGSFPIPSLLPNYQKLSTYSSALDSMLTKKQ